MKRLKADYEGKNINQEKNLENNQKYVSDFMHNLNLGGEDDVAVEEKLVRFGSLNCSGIAGKIHLLDNAIEEFNLDFLFLMETWTAPGRCRSLSRKIVFSQEYDRPSNGRYHYGQAIYINESRVRRGEISLVADDLEKHLLVFEYAGVRFILSLIHI